MPEQVTLDVQVREISVMPESVNAESRTFDIIFTTGADVERYGRFSEGYERYIEELVVTPEAVDLSRLNNGAPVLDTHSSWSLADIVAGVVPGSARIEGGKGFCTVQFLDAGVDGDSDVLFAKVRKGIIRNISVGYRIISATEIRNPGELMRLRVDKWQPMETSFVPMGADDEAVVRSEEKRRQFTATIQRSGESTMTTKSETKSDAADPNLEARENPNAETVVTASAAVNTSQERADEIMDLATLAGRSLADARGWVKSKKTVAEIRSEIADAAAEQAERTATTSQHDAPEDGGGLRLADNMRSLLASRNLKPLH